jgi:hypothetical protein
MQNEKDFLEKWRCDKTTFLKKWRSDKTTFLAGLLLTAFYWNNTPQGRDYWEGVYDNLIKLADSETDTYDKVTK